MHVIAATLLIWVQVFLIWSSGGDLNILIPAGLLPLLAAVMSLPSFLVNVCRTAATVIVPTAVIVAILSWKTDPDLPSQLIPEWITIPLATGLLVLQAAWFVTGFSRTATPQSSPILAVITLGIACCRYIENTQQSSYFICIVVAFLLVGLQLHLTRCQPKYVDSSHRVLINRVLITGRRFAVGAVLLMAMLFTSLVAVAWQTSVTKIQASLPELLASSFESEWGFRSYARNGILTAITSEKTTDPTNVAMRVFADSTPGYLRGRVFDTYNGVEWRLQSHMRGKWNGLRNKTLHPPLESMPRGIELNYVGNQLFKLDDADDTSLIPIEVHNDARRGEMFFTPLGTRYVEGSGESVITDEYGAIYSGIDSSTPYIAYVNPVVVQQMESIEQSILTDVYAGFSSEVGELSDAVCEDCESSVEKIRAIRGYLRSNYQYGENLLPLRSGVEPVSEFILNGTSAHCEFFASAAVLMLRTQNVPCRYVTGYLVTELEDEFDEYYIARNRDAHAWAEAYDNQSESWIIVEATPGVPLNLDQTSTLPGDSVSSDEVSRGDLSGRTQWLDRFIRQTGQSIAFWILLLILPSAVAVFLMAARNSVGGVSTRARLSAARREKGQS